MRFLIFITLLVASLSVQAQKEKEVKPDTTFVEAEIPPTMEKVILFNQQEIADLQNPQTIQKRIDQLSQQNAVLIQSLKETKKFDQSLIIDQIYRPGKLIWKLKPAPIPPDNSTKPKKP